MGKHSHRNKEENTIWWAHFAIGILMLAVSGVIIGIAVGFPNATFPLPATTDFGGTTLTVLTIETTWLLLAATLVNGIVHLYYLARKRCWYDYRDDILNYGPIYDHRMARHVNYTRWCLYGVFGSLLLWPVAQHAGVSNIFLLFTLVVLNVLLQRSAFVQEMANAGAEKSEDVNFYPFAFGLLAFATIWTTVLAHFFQTAPPAAFWVTIAVIGAAVASGLFGLLIFVRYMRLDKRWKYDSNVEIAYIVLEILLAVVIVVPLLIHGATL